MEKNLGYRIRRIIEKHDFSIAWSSAILWSSLVLIFKDLPASVQETLPYNGSAVGIIGVIIFILKSFGIYYRKFAFHSIVDFIGATWLIFMGAVVSTSVPAMIFTGSILFGFGVMVNVRLAVRSFAQKRR